MFVYVLNKRRQFRRESVKLKVKMLLKFYFCADSLNKAFDNIILKRACAYGEVGRDTFESICALIGEKTMLSGLWSYIDAVVRAMPDGDVPLLEEYALLRTGLKCVEAERAKAMRRAAVKFARRALRLENFGKEIKAVERYCSLLKGVTCLV